MKYTEKRVKDASHDVFVFIKAEDKKPYVYYGRALPIRAQYNWEPGKPSHIVFDSYEYAQKENNGYSSESFEGQSFSDIEANTPSYSHIEPKTVASTENDRIQKVRTAQSKYSLDSLEFWEKNVQSPVLIIPVGLQQVILSNGENPQMQSG